MNRVRARSSCSVALALCCALALCPLPSAAALRRRRLRPELDRAGQRLRPRHRRQERRADRSADPRAASGQRRRRGGRDGADHRSRTATSANTPSRCSRTTAAASATRSKDNGLLILLAIKERKVWVEVGYGLEQWITDGFAGETSRQYMVPQFRNGALRPGPARRHVAHRRPHRGGPAGHAGRASPASAKPSPSGGSIWPLLPILIFIAILVISRIGRGGGGGGLPFWALGRGAAGRAASGRLAAGSRRRLRRRVSAAASVDRRRWRRRLRRLRRRRQRRRRRRCRLVRKAVNWRRMKITRRLAAQLVLLGFVALSAVRLLVQHVRQPGRSDQGAVGAGREPAPAAQRPDSRISSRP